jgi:hypothetical protein
MQWILGTLSLEVKQLECEALHSNSFSAMVKDVRSFTCIPSYLYGMVLKQRVKFTFCCIGCNKGLTSTVIHMIETTYKAKKCKFRYIKIW